MRYQGRIVRWNEARGFGFIAPSRGMASQKEPSCSYISRRCSQMARCPRLASGSPISLAAARTANPGPSRCSLWIDRCRWQGECAHLGCAFCGQTGCDRGAAYVNQSTPAPRLSAPQQLARQADPAAGAGRDLLHLLPLLGRVGLTFANFFFQSAGSRQHRQPAGGAHLRPSVRRSAVLLPDDLLRGGDLVFAKLPQYQDGRQRKRERDSL